MAGNVDVWTGLTLVLGTTGVSFKITKWTWTPGKKASINVTHHGSTKATAAHTFGGGEKVLGILPDPGVWTFEILHDPTLAFPVLSTSVFETLTVQPPSQVCSGAFSASGKMAAPPQFGHGVDDAPVATIEFELTGIVTMPSA